MSKGGGGGREGAPCLTQSAVAGPAPNRPNCNAQALLVAHMSAAAPGRVLLPQAKRKRQQMHRPSCMQLAPLPRKTRRRVGRSKY